MSLPGHLLSHIQFLKNPIFDRTTPLTFSRIKYAYKYASFIFYEGREIWGFFRESQNIFVPPKNDLSHWVYLWVMGNGRINRGINSSNKPSVRPALESIHWGPNIDTIQPTWKQWTFYMLIWCELFALLESEIIYLGVNTEIRRVVLLNTFFAPRGELSLTLRPSYYRCGLEYEVVHFPKGLDRYLSLIFAISWHQ